MAPPINLSKKTSTSKSTKTLKNTKAVKSTKVIKSTKTLKSSNDDSNSLTICTENNFDDSKRKNIIPERKENINVKFNNKKYTEYESKQDALKYMNMRKDISLKLFSKDLPKDKQEKGESKIYIVTTYDNMYYLSMKKNENYYEHYEEGQAMKLIICIDCKIPNKKDDEDEMERDKEKKKNGKIKEITPATFNDNLISCVQKINKSLKKTTDFVPNTDFAPNIVILKSYGEDRMCAHIIYTNFIFNSFAAMGCFVSEIKSRRKEDYIDMTIYRTGCVRLLWSSKIGMPIPLTYNDSDYMFLSKNKYKYESDYELFIDCMITNINKDSTLIEIDVPEQIKEIKKDKININEGAIEIDVIKKYLDILSIKRADKYSDWICVGLCLYNCNSSDECLLLWDEWSKKSTKSYNGQYLICYKWKFFKKNDFTIDTLKVFARTDNPAACRLINYTDKFVDNKPGYKTIAIEKNYLLDKTGEKSYEKIKDKKTIVTQNICKWVESNNIKTLSIKSPYNTGKTSLITQLINEYEDKFERISFITHRQSLTNELHGTFGNYGFCSYMNNIYDSDRIICQIESLHKLRPEEDPLSFDDEEMIVSYDLVILDEVESLLYHYESSTVKQKQSNFALMMDIIKNSKKVLALDGDFHNRAYYFLCNFGESLIIHNMILKDKKNFIFTNDLVKFENSIDDHLIIGNNIIIVTMSANIATKYNNKYKDQYKTLMHCGFSDDKMKELLKDVETNWMKDLIIYSPSVQAGVSFDKPHFDKMYVVLSSKSCSPRDLNQMCHRVRQFECNNVEVYLNGMPFNEKADFFTFDEAKERVKIIHDKYSVKYKNVENHETDPYMKTLIYNELENLNKAPYFFVPMFIKLITEKGNTFSFDETKKIRNGKAKGMDFNKESVKNAEDIDKETYSEYLKKQMRNEATSNMKFAIEKYLYKKHWKIDILTDDFLDKWFRKTYVLHNLRNLTGFDINGHNWGYDEGEDYYLTIDTDTNKKYVDYNKAKHKERIECVLDLINTLGFDVYNIGKQNMLSKEIYETNRLETLENAKIFKDKKLGSLFDINAGNLRTNRAFMGFANNLLQHYGLCIKTVRKSSRNKITKKYISLLSYHLDFLQDMKEYL